MLDERDLSIGERPNVDPCRADDTDRLIVVPDRHPEVRAKAARPLDLRVDEVGIGQDVNDLDDPGVADGPRDDRPVAGLIDGRRDQCLNSGVKPVKADIR
jgi:hypothetical protein